MTTTVAAMPLPPSLPTAAASSRGGMVTSLNRNDVLLGRGSGPNQFIGNQQFREFVDIRREEYTTAVNVEVKKRIAQEVVSQVYARGGRFLRPEGKKSKVDSGITDGRWYQVDNKVALEKAKQALREKNVSTSTSSSSSAAAATTTAADATPTESMSSSSSFLGRKNPSSTTGHRTYNATKLSNEEGGGAQRTPLALSAKRSAKRASTDCDGSLSVGQSDTVTSNRDIALAFAPNANPPSSSPPLAMIGGVSFSLGNMVPGSPPSSSDDIHAGATAPTYKESSDATSPVASSSAILLPLSPTTGSGSGSFTIASPPVVNASLLLYQNAVYRNALLQQQQNALSWRQQREQQPIPTGAIHQHLFPPCTTSVHPSFSSPFHGNMTVSNTSTRRQRPQDDQPSSWKSTNKSAPRGTASASAADIVNNSAGDEASSLQFRDCSLDSPAASPSYTPEPEPPNTATGRTAATAVSSDEPSPKDDGGGGGEDEVAAFVLSSLAITDRPVITDEQEAMERATLSDDEKAAILVDAFGNYCSVNNSRQQSKRARKDLDPESIAFLVRLMKNEIGNIPASKRTALIEAQTKARADEFCDARLVKFLRCEGMNAKLAAQRFVQYWQYRREVFGPDKFAMRMSLSEALRDDLVALQVGLCSILPYPDLSGRQLLYMESRRHTREGYTSESMLRAIWYVYEVAAQENTDVGSGMIQLSWVKGATILDYDLHVYDRWAFYQANAWPLKTMVSHVCCSPRIISRVVKPIIMAFTNKWTRTRTLMHDVAESEIISELEKYGIEESMLPTAMGGTFQLDQSEWIASRHAAEMEEIQ